MADLLTLGLCLLLICTVSVDSIAYTCQELKNGQIPSSGYKVACVVVEGNQDAALITDNLFFKDGDTTESFTSISSDKTQCKSAASTWTYQSWITGELDCTIEFTVILVQASVNVIAVIDDPLAHSLTGDVSYTMVSPRGGMRFTFLKGKNSITTFYSGAGTGEDELFLMANYSNEVLPQIFFAFEPIVTIHNTPLSPSNTYTTFYVTSDYRESLNWSRKDKIVVSNSGKANNLQNSHASDNVLTIVPYDPNALVGVNPIIVALSSSEHYVETYSETVADEIYRDYTITNSNASSYNIVVPETLKINYPTSIPPTAVGKNPETFLIEFTYLGNAPPEPTSGPDTTIAPTLPTTTSVATTTKEVITTASTRTPTTTQTTTTRGTPQPDPQLYCNCGDWSTIWLDIVSLIDISKDMGKDGAYANLALTQASLTQINLMPDPSGRFFSRAAIVAFSQNTTILGNFGNLTTIDSIMNVELPAIETDALNISKAIGVAKNILDTHQVDPSIKRRQVIIIMASTYSPGDYKAALDFKTGGGIIIVIGYVQTDNPPNPDLVDLASPGYFFTNSKDSDLDFNDIIQAFCDINCFCNPNNLAVQSYAENSNKRNVPSGGCYESFDVKVSEIAAKSACKHNGGILPAIHDSDKQFFLMQQFPSKTSYWIGYERVNGVWAWEDNSTNPYVSPYGFNPNGVGNCVYSQQTTGFKSTWTTADCVKKEAHHYTCQTRPCDAMFYCF